MTADTAWALRRLRAMPASEILHRAKVRVRDRVAPPPYHGWTPEQACERLFACPPDQVLRSSRTGVLFGPVYGADAATLEATLRAATLLRAGQWTVFGHEVWLGDPPDWRRNPATGASWPDVASDQLDYRRADVAGGAKYAWELGRLTVLPTLALAWRVSGEESHAALATRWLDDWSARNPLGHGIHHSSGIEMAVRVLTVSATLALLGERAAAVRLAPCLGLLAQQALWCRDHLSVGSSANNHLIAEYAAMATMGALYPALRDAPALLGQGLDGLQQETLRQFHEDGVPAEQAFGYLPFVWELLLIAFVAAERAGRTVRDDVRRRLRATLEFARVVRLPAGRWPAIGDEDDGRILLAAEGPSRWDLVGNALAAWLGEPPLADGSSELASLLFGPRPLAPREPVERAHQFRHGGYTVYRERSLLVTWDHGPLGLGPLAAHGHADALALTFFRGEDGVIVDPGTFAYHDDLEARDRFRSTPYHSTVNFAGRTQSEMLGPFLWGERARLAQQDEGWACTWWTGERHWRRVALIGSRLRIEDRVEGPKAELVFVLHPAARVELDGMRAHVTVGATRAEFRAEGIAGWHLAPGEFSPRFGQRQETKRLTAPLPGPGCRTEIEVRGA